MKDIFYSTENERRLISSMQRKINIDPNGVIGMNTLSTMAFMLGVELEEPLTLDLYGHPTIIGNDLLAFSPKSGIKGYKNSLSGSFTYPSGVTPCSILVNKGVALCTTACHAHIGKPESVIYRKTTGEIKIARVKSRSELPSSLRWAVGGMGLLDNYDPAAEGFTGVYADVLRKTNHTVLGIRNGKVYGVYFKKLTAAQINTLCKNKFRFDKAILLDGGSQAAINGTEYFAQISTGTKQGYALQLI